MSNYNLTKTVPYNFINQKSLLSLQLLKFILVGVLNTAVDFLVLNVLITLFIPENNSGVIIVFKAIAFIFAVTNSYIWNKFWVFRERSNGSKKEGASFFVISMTGFLLNIVVFTLVLQVLNGFGYANLGTQVLSNIAAFFGTISVLIFNFLGYKFLVFKTNQ